MIVVKYPDDSRYFATPEGQFLRKEDKYYKMTIEKGTRIEVIDSASRLLPSGKRYFLECLCEIEKEEIIFDYPADGYWEPLSSKFIIWDEPINSNKTAERNAE